MKRPLLFAAWGFVLGEVYLRLPMVWQILPLFGIQSLTLFLGVTGTALLIFALLYCAMYRLTSNAYYRIVSTQNA